MEWEEVERGERIPDVRRRTPSGIVVSVRLDHEDAERLLALAARRGMNIVQVATAAVRTYLGVRVD